jgi:hypothetical protein
MRRVLWLLCFATWLSVSTQSFAQDEAEDEESESPVAESEDGDAADTEAAPDAEAKPAPAAAAASDAAPTWWVGPYLEGIVVPSFLLKLFLAASPTVFNASYGATITHRNPDGFSWVLGLGYAGYGFDGPFRAKGDPELDTEYLNSSLGLLNVRGMLLWSADISSKLSFEYGVGIQLGVVLGEMRRTEAYKTLGGEYAACAGVATPDLMYCEPTTNGQESNLYNEEGAHYHVKEERVPPVAAALMIPALGLRYTPVNNIAIKVEAAFGLLQFSFGISASYGIDET